MKHKNEKLLWIVFAGVLVILFILSSTDLIIKEKEQEVYSVSVIIEDARDDYYVNYRKGVDRAAIEMHADVSFITLYNAGSSRQQMDFILREQQDGAQALIISPIRETEMSAALVDGRIQKPVVLLNSSLTEGNVAASISPDYFNMGVMLADAVLAEQKDDRPVYLFTGESMSESTYHFYDGICTKLEEMDRRYDVFSRRRDAGFRDKLEQTVAGGKTGLVIIALDQETLTEVAALLSEQHSPAADVAGLYGRGSTVAILNYLDKGIISGICAVDDFSAGYLSVKMALDAITKQQYYGGIQLESYYIRKEDLTRPEYEKKLYPIE